MAEQEIHAVLSVARMVLPDCLCGETAHILVAGGCVRLDYHNITTVMQGQ